MKTIILDTSFLVACAEFKIDYEQEIRRIMHEQYALAIVDRTIDELDALVEKGGKPVQHSKLAKAIFLRKKINVISTSGGHVDTLILRTATPQTHLVATIDAELKKKLQQKGTGLIVIRQKKYLAVE